jgi:L-lactate dehydrogenase complex protein LldE
MRTPHLFIPCLVDRLYPEAGMGAVTLLSRLDCAPQYDPRQTCCGQPGFNAGYHDEARQIAEHFIDVFKNADEIVSLSGSCAAMVRVFYTQLGLPPALQRKAEAICGNLYEFTEYIVHVIGISDLGLAYNGRVAYHDSCHIMRELNIMDEPRALLKAVRGLELIELDRGDRCCGFGGLFSAKFPELSTAMGEEKLESIRRADVDVVVGCDNSCLMHLQSLAHKRGMNIKVKHIAEFLAGLAGVDDGDKQWK